MKKLILLLLINILINFCCVGKSPVENKPVIIYNMTEVNVVYYDLYCYNYKATEPINDRQIILDKMLKTKKGFATGNIQVFENLVGFGGFYSYEEDYPLNESSISISGVDSLNSNTDILNGNIIVKIYENHSDLSEFLKEYSGRNTYFRIAYIQKIYICGILIN